MTSARLGIVAADLAALDYESRLAADWIRLVLRFLAATLRDGEGMHNLLTYRGVWADEPHVGRAIWATAAIAQTAGVPAELRERASPRPSARLRRGRRGRATHRRGRPG
jgi:hypothetical protein